MNIETANKLLQYRKKNNLSQEELAEKIGVSRQAISKWERAEASPDTDNLILLAKLYGVSLDEMLSPEIEAKSVDEINGESKQPQEDKEDETKAENDCNKKEKVHIGMHGIHIVDKDDEVHIDRHGIHVKDKDGTNVDIGKNGIYVNDEEYNHHTWFVRILKSIPYSIIVTAAYLVMGFCYGLWHPGWLIFLTIPIFDSIIESIGKKNPNKFSMAMLCVFCYLYGGCVYSMWHPAWIIFFLIPIYHSIFGAVYKEKNQKYSCDCDKNEYN